MGRVIREKIRGTDFDILKCISDIQEEILSRPLMEEYGVQDTGMG